MAKIVGNTTATPNPRPDWNQTDPTKADFIKNKPNLAVEANPAESETGYLKKIAIGGTVYSINNSYLLAKENGYLGTEEEFGEKLAELLNLKIYDDSTGDVVDSELPLYRGLTEEVDQYIVFSIAETEYLAKKDSLWSEWIESADNSGGYVIGPDNNVWYGDKCAVFFNGATVAASDAILSDISYTHAN